jgi:TonB family protein
MGIEGRVVLKGLVNTHGRIEPASILVLEITDADFVSSAYQALIRALFRPARLAGKATEAWITIAIDFTLSPDARHARF